VHFLPSVEASPSVSAFVGYRAQQRLLVVIEAVAVVSGIEGVGVIVGVLVPWACRSAAEVCPSPLE